MASTASVASTTGNTPPNPSTSNSSQSNGAGRPPMRSSSAAKGRDGARKQSPTDAASRRPTQKAWTGGTNPLTQRGSTPTQPNGVNPHTKSSNVTKMNTSKDVGISDKHAHDRLTFILGAATGLNISLTTKTSEKYEGIMAGCVLAGGNIKISTKMTKKYAAYTHTSVNGVANREASLVGSSPDFAMSFEIRDIAEVFLPEFSLPEPVKVTNGASSKFQTDSDISGNQIRGEKTLQKWMPDKPSDTDFSLESGPTGEWDQFATNQSLFGAHSTYDENLYTTVLDRSSASYKMREANAARIAREIETSSSTNVHLREERGQVAEAEEGDEEDRYSGVKRSDPTTISLPGIGINKYTPPARRPPSGQPTVPGAPVDPAIVSSQLSRPDVPKSGSASAKSIASLEAEATVETKIAAPATTTSATSTNVAGTTLAVTAPTTAPTDVSSAETIADQAIKERGANASVSPHRAPPVEGQTEGFEAKVLQTFRQFAEAEKHKLVEKKRAQASHDRTAKLNELRRFSTTFKLNTPIPADLVGILAKDPVKQEAIIEKAQKDSEESVSTAASPAASATSTSATRKVDLPQMTPIPDRQTFNRGRGGFPQTNARSDRGGQAAAPLFPATRNAFPQRSAGGQADRKASVPHQIPAPIPIVEGRIPPSGPMAEQTGFISPQRSAIQTPLSATSAKFNLNVKASEFRPNAAAPAFNPAASSNAPSSPSSIQRTASVSRTASPSTFFGSRKPKSPSERVSITTAFNPIKKMQNEVAAKRFGDKSTAEESIKDSKDYSANGGIPFAYQTGPRWNVRTENSERTYLQAFERPIAPIISPTQSRSGSTHHIPYQNQLPHMPPGPSNVPQITTPQHLSQAGHHNFTHHFEDGHQRLQMQGSPQVYPSPSIQSRQISAYASPSMGHHAQLAYGQQPYFGAAGTPMQMPLRQFPGTPGMMHAQVGQMAAPMMVQQQSNGPYMQVPQQYNPQMPMYSPNPAHVYPQQNGYGSPSRAPMMIQQGSQQSHHHAPQMMYTMSSQGGPVAYPQQGQMFRGGYTGNQYGANHHQQPFPMQQRAMSSGYGQIPQKAIPQQMQPGQGPPMNAPQQPAAFLQTEVSQDDGK